MCSVFPKEILVIIFCELIKEEKGKAFKTTRSLSVGLRCEIDKLYPNGDVKFADHLRTLILKYDKDKTTEPPQITISISTSEVFLRVSFSSSELKWIIYRNLAIIHGYYKFETYWDAICQYDYDHRDDFKSRSNHFLYYIIHDGRFTVPPHLKSDVWNFCIIRGINDRSLKYVLFGLPERVLTLNKFFVISRYSFLTITDITRYTEDIKSCGLYWDPTVFDYRNGTLRIEELYDDNGNALFYEDPQVDRGVVFARYCRMSPHIPPGYLCSRYQKQIAENPRIAWGDVEIDTGCVDTVDLTKKRIPLDVARNVNEFLWCKQHKSLYCKKCMYQLCSYTWKDITQSEYDNYKDQIIHNTFEQS